MKQNLSNEEIKKEFETFEKDKMSLVLSTSDELGDPLSSYSPFVKIDNDYYICISSNLPHFTNILHRKKAHVMIIEDENKAFNIYARKRLYFSVTCTIEEHNEKIFTLFDERYGESLSFLRNMPDFRIIKLIAEEKSLVLGFGAAYVMSTDGDLKNKNIQHK